MSNKTVEKIKYANGASGWKCLICGLESDNKKDALDCCNPEVRE